MKYGLEAHATTFAGAPWLQPWDREFGTGGPNRTRRTIRILYVITDLELGGVPLHLLRLARAVREHGLDPSVVCLAPPGPVSAMLADTGISTAALGARGPWDWRVLEALAELIAEKRPDVVHALLFHANLAARAACPLSGFPTGRLICEIQTAEIERPWHLILDRWTQRACRYIVGNSPSVIEHLGRAGIEPQRLRLIQGGIDPAPIQSASPISRAELGFADSDPLILWVGRLDPVKGLDELIDAFDQLRARRPCNLVLVGDGRYRQEIEARMASARGRSSIHLLGARTDVPRLLKSADLFVFPSRTEGLPNALLEAMAAGLPCIAADVPGCRDVIEHEVSGLLVPPRNPPALASAMDRLLSDPDLAKSLGRTAAAQVEGRFRLSETHRAYLSLYREVATARTGSA